MPTLTIPNSFQANTKIKSADVNANFTAIATLLNTTKLDSTNVQQYGLTRDRLLAGTNYGVVCNDSAGVLGAGVAPGSSGNVLTSNGTSWVSQAPTAANNPYVLLNLGLTNSVALSALTLALKQADGSTDPASGNGTVSIGMRSSTATSGAYNIRAITSALSLVISSGTTLGLPASQNNNLWIYAIDTDGAGTMALGASSLKYDEGSLQSTVAESAVATVTIASPGVVTLNNHGYNAGDAVSFTTSGALPTGITAGTTYYVLSPSTNTFTLAASPGGTAINTSGSQSGTHTLHVTGWRLVSNGAYANKPVRLIGRAVFNLASAGVWASAATELDVAGPGTLMAPETIAVRYSQSGSFASLAASTNYYFDFGTKDYDTHGAVLGAGGSVKTSSNSGWRFIAPSPGKFEMSATASWATGTGVAIGTFLSIYVNGVEKSRGQVYDATTAKVSNVQVSVFDEISLAANDRVEFILWQNSSGAQSTTAAAAANYASIKKVA